MSRKKTSFDFVSTNRFYERARVVLTIGGSDPTGGAGIQADLKTFQHFGVHGLSAITAVTVQNTSGVISKNPVSAELVREQLETLANDIEFSVAKIGMLPSAEIVHVVAEFFNWKAIGIPVVLDPILASSNGVPFLDEEAIEVMKTELFPRMALVTPNLPEIATLTGIHIEQEASMIQAALAFQDIHARGVLVKGGHGDGSECRDLLHWAGEMHWLSSPRIPKEVHGTGCVLSAAIVSGMALNKSLPDAVTDAKIFIGEMLKGARPLGAGQDIFEFPPFSIN
jgi:hydroxymethylpyrimidine/phosphomethylpyrimidine kinase